jgi:putative DNA primase/helicase
VNERADGSAGLLEAARAAHAAGFCVLPPRQDGSKRPIGNAWEQYQQERPTEATLTGWYGDPVFSAFTGLGLVCGAVSGNLELFEFDDPDTHVAFKAAALASRLGPLVERIEAGYLERTPGGVHWFTRCTVIAANTRLACRPKQPAEMVHPNDKVKVLIETRGEGGYAVVAPSNGRVHPTGRPYVRERGSFTTISIITPDEREALWELARSFDLMPRTRATEPVTVSPLGTTERPGDAFNQRATWPEVLEPHGWAQVYDRGEVTYWRRPGKNRGVSATTNFARSALLYVFSSSTLFEPERGYGKFAAYALLNHDGDYQAAARALAAQGYGGPGELVLRPTGRRLRRLPTLAPMPGVRLPSLGRSA